jgi:glutathione reductase (NADPH)
VAARSSTSHRRPIVHCPANQGRLATRASSQTSNGTSASSSSPSDFDFDLFCIGAGSGGVRAARVAAGTYGAKVAICELPYGRVASDEVGGAGGTCVLRGCVPKKLFVYCASYRETMRDARGFGWQVPDDIALDWSSFMEKKNAELARLNGIYNTMLKNSGVEYIEGRGKLLDAHTVEVAGRRFTARNIVIATGARAHVPTFEGSDLAIISDLALEVPKVPGVVAVIGGGYIALEFAGVFAGLGAEVHVAFRADAPLRGFDADVRKFATEQYGLNGLKMHPKTTPKRIVKRPDGRLTLTLAGKDSQEIDIVCDHVLAATGRKPNVAGLGLETVGVALGKDGEIVVDQYSQTNVPSVWAVGDVTGRMALTPVALMESMALTKTLFGGVKTPADHVNVPTAVFSNPEIGTVGLSEAEAVEKFGEVDVFTSSFKPMRNTISGAQGRTFMKLLVDVASDKVVGAHMVGPDSAEIMQGIGVAVKMGATKAQMDSTIGVHPSAAEEFVTMRTPTRRATKAAVAAA